jgi:ABC-type glucose/galactose transport system permease subunit
MVRLILFPLAKVVTGELTRAVVTRPVLLSVVLVLPIEIPLLIFMSLYGCESFAFWLSNSRPVAKIVENMWRTIDWYIPLGPFLSSYISIYRPSQPLT